MVTSFLNRPYLVIDVEVERSEQSGHNWSSILNIDISICNYFIDCVECKHSVKSGICVVDVVDYQRVTSVI